jgi:hypothetical protein
MSVHSPGSMTRTDSKHTWAYRQGYPPIHSTSWRPFTEIPELQPWKLTTCFYKSLNRDDSSFWLLSLSKSFTSHFLSTRFSPSGRVEFDFAHRIPSRRPVQTHHAGLSELGNPGELWLESSDLRDTHHIKSHPTSSTPHSRPFLFSPPSGRRVDLISRVVSFTAIFQAFLF